MTLVAIILTIVCIAAGVVLVHVTWSFVIEPIVDHISDVRESYWQKRWNEMNDIRSKLEVACMDYRRLLHKMGLHDDMIKHMYSIDTVRREDLNERGNLEMKITIELTPEE